MQLVKTLARKITVKSVVRFFGRIAIIGALCSLLVTLLVGLLAPYAGTGVLCPIGLFVAYFAAILVTTVGTFDMLDRAIFALDRLTERLPA